MMYVDNIAGNQSQNKGKHKSILQLVLLFSNYSVDFIDIVCCVNVHRIYFQFCHYITEIHVNTNVWLVLLAISYVKKHRFINRDCLYIWAYNVYYFINSYFSCDICEHFLPFVHLTQNVTTSI